MRLFRFLRLPLVLLFVFHSIFAQNAVTDAEKEKEKARVEQEKRQEVEKKSIAMLGEIASEADSLRLAVNRVSVFSTVAVLFWKYDEKQARNLVNVAAKEIINAQNADEETGDANWQIQEARRQLVTALAPYDAELALQVFRQTRAAEIAALMQSANKLFPNGNDYSRLQNEIQTEQTLANEIAKQDPKRAVRLAREILEKGVSYALLELIERIREKDPEEAARLADDVLRKLQDANFSASYTDRNLAINFITRLTQKQESGGAEKSKFVVNESSLRALVEKLTAFFLRDPQVDGYYYQIPTFIPILEKFSPSRANQLRQREAEIKQRQALNNPYERLNQINQDADAETLITEAQNAQPEMKSQYYSYAANKLISSDNTERARVIINSIPDRRLREYALQNLNNNLFYKAISAGNVAEARRLAALAPTKTQQVSFYVQIFNFARQKQDDKLARQILDEAASLLTPTPENNVEMNAIFQLASAYSQIAPETALALIEPTVPKANELLNASIVLSRFSSTESSQPDEITMPFFHTSLSQYGFYFNQNDFFNLATANFERTKSLGDGFQRPEAKIFTRLMIIQGILSRLRNTSAENYVLEGKITRFSQMTYQRWLQ